MKDLFNENYLSLMKEIEEYTRNGKKLVFRDSKNQYHQNA